jgi:hypothetical protein
VTTGEVLCGPQSLVLFDEISTGLDRLETVCSQVAGLLTAVVTRGVLGSEFRGREEAARAAASTPCAAASAL